MAADTPSAKPASHRPRTTTVFVAAFVAGAAAAVGVNRALDVHLAQAKPQVECEPIFVALRALPSGAPITVWDVALRDLPKAMVPATALRVTDSFEGRILKFPLREGQPLISGQLVQPEPAPPAAADVPGDEPQAREELVEEAFVAPVPAATPVATASPEPAAEVATQRTVEPPAASDGAAQAVIDAAATEVAANAPAPQATEPAAEPAAGVADPVPPAGEPTPAVAASEPVSIDADRDPVLAAPAALPIQTADQSPTGAATELDLPSPPPIDVSKLPSIMAAEGPTAAPEGTSARPGVRYLVVPERIARQADTSFTTPAAPSAAPDEPADRSAAPLPQATASRTEPAPAGRQPQAETAPSRRPPQGQTPQRKTATRQQDQRPTQPRQAAPRSTAQPKPSEQTAAAGRPATGPRAWGGMFPNVSAGLEAFGGWRSGRTAPAQSEPGSTTR